MEMPNVERNLGTLLWRRRDFGLQGLDGYFDAFLHSFFDFSPNTVS
jgi:hypothetical protein